MTLDDFHREILHARPELVDYRRSDGGYSFSIGSKRVIRLQPLSGARINLVKSASERATKSKQREAFSGSLAELLAILDAELALIQDESQKPIKPVSTPRTTERSRRLVLGQAPAPRAVVKQLKYDSDWNRLAGKKGVIYRWEIFAGNERVGVYIGLTEKQTPEARIGKYVYRVEALQLGSPYLPTKPDGYRKIHRALVEAMHQGHRVVLTLISSIQPGMSLAELESALIRQHDSFGPGAHQLNERP